MTDSQVLTLATEPRARTAVLQQASAALRAGQLVVIPTDTSYAVVADAFAAEAIAQLRAAKKQDQDVPLPIGCATLETAHGVAVLEGAALDLAAAVWPGALTMLVRAQPSLSWSIGSSDAGLAIRVPGHEITSGVLAAVGPCVMTGAQAAGGSPVTNVDEARAVLGDAVAIYVDCGPVSGAVSSVVDATGPHLRLVREGALGLDQLRDIVPMLVRATP